MKDFKNKHAILFYQPGEEKFTFSAILGFQYLSAARVKIRIGDPIEFFIGIDAKKSGLPVFGPKGHLERNFSKSMSIAFLSA